MQWLTLWFALQTGLVSQTMVIDSSYWSTPDNSLEVTMEVKALVLEHLEIAGFLNSWQAPDFSAGITNGIFDPFRIDYGVSASIVWGGLKVGVTHECDHPVTQAVHGASTGPYFGLTSTELFVRFEAKIDF
jgi:hypothetical protein